MNWIGILVSSDNFLQTHLPSQHWNLLEKGMVVKRSKTIVIHASQQLYSLELRIKIWFNFEFIKETSHMFMHKSWNCSTLAIPTIWNIRFVCENSKSMKSQWQTIEGMSQKCVDNEILEEKLISLYWHRYGTIYFI